ncbi:MAG TPA: hypothetical protein VLG12_05080 [Candidatus Saccharimonadales bacterium]|nr:hypothetical protein [Candidatus Saccharimonadales bacterium]
MAHIITGLFSDTQQAGDAVAELKNKNYTGDISIISKNMENGKIDTQSVKEDGTEGAATGATLGAIAGGAATILAGVTAVAIPGIGLVAGPIATALAAATTGGVAGGLVGYLVDKGIPDNAAQTYQDRIQSGDIFISAEVEHGNEADVERILMAHGATEIQESHKDF